ncbi:hypothetical Protein YC6258_04394 [Gynuella sunshinyii YC6258]|uniref:Uncharacterized protein n=1 Tax=Gynuella sunshinyii YC6258 TaxID=1445510 RepID=A0A0C5VQ88_9GAMM|nr:hypothetical Protein YC6258_04394 [Gynuella sunshinyii YC6258]
MHRLISQMAEIWLYYYDNMASLVIMLVKINGFGRRLYLL